VGGAFGGVGAGSAAEVAVEGSEAAAAAPLVQ